MNINEYLIKHRKGKTAPSIVCKDGFTMSVQAGQYMYCEPRQDQGPWTKVEVGFPNRGEADLVPYAEDRNNLTQTVYGYVSVSLVEAIIAKHGGMLND